LNVINAGVCCLGNLFQEAPAAGGLSAGKL